MDIHLKTQFLERWEKYFCHAELPFVFYFTDGDGGAPMAVPAKGRSCIICELAKVRKGESVCYDEEAIICGGAKRYLGFAPGIRPNFEYFLSCGIQGKMEGERYIKTPEMVVDMMKKQPSLNRQGKHIVFKRWDKLEASDNPEVVIFIAKPDVLSGLFTLANYDQAESDSTIAPFGAGCGSIVYYPYFEKDKERPRAVLGMFDPSARPCVPGDTLSFAVPMNKFEKMIANMDECFLITDTWTTVLSRIEKNK